MIKPKLQYTETAAAVAAEYSTVENRWINRSFKKAPHWQNGRARHACDTHDGVKGDLREARRSSTSIRHDKVADGQRRGDRGDDQIERRDGELEYLDAWVLVRGARRQQYAVSHVAQYWSDLNAVLAFGLFSSEGSVTAQWYCSAAVPAHCSCDRSVARNLQSRAVGLPSQINSAGTQFCNRCNSHQTLSCYSDCISAAYTITSKKLNLSLSY